MLGKQPRLKIVLRKTLLPNYIICLIIVDIQILQYFVCFLIIIQMKQASGDSIKVFIRVRPLNEKQKNSQPCVSFNDSNIQMKDKDPDHRFSYDHIFGMQSNQQEVYDLVGHQVVNSAFEGFNGTVFAYGQTSSGKTHTCIGPDYSDPQKQGILPRMVNHIFQNIQKAPSYIQFRIKISIVEIYLEKIKDLLDVQKNDLKIREKAGKGIYIQDVSQQYVASASQTMQILKKGINNRSVGQTNMNDTSSRSHMAFIITLYQNNLKDASAKSGKIILVDLAGSQKVSKTGAEGKLLDEAKQINKSLSALGNVINSLTQSKISHIPYRDSKLTRLLQESLGGNSKTNLIINVSPSDYNEQQTLSSLRFGFRAKQIKNKPKINKQYTVAQLLLLLQKSQKRIQQLQQYIKQLTSNPNASIIKEKRKSMMKKTHQVYVENLLDSDNPIIQSQQEILNQNKGIQQLEDDDNDVVNKSINKSKVKLHFQSQFQSESQSEAQGGNQLAKKIKNNKNAVENTENALQEINNKIQEQKQMLCDQIQSLNIEKVELLRDLDILQQKYQVLSKDTKINNNKINYLQKQNQKLLEKVVSEGCAYQEVLAKMKEMEQTIQVYEQQILKFAAVQQGGSTQTKDRAIKNMFGLSSKQSNTIPQSTRKMVDLVKKNKAKNTQNLFVDEQFDPIQQKINKQIQENVSKNEQIASLKLKLKKSQEQIALFKNLQMAKESFIQQKLKFGAERQRLYKDLQDRIQKVLELSEKLDESYQKIRYYQQLVKMSQSEKGRKISLLQQHLNEISESYYVLKGQQSSWLKDNQKTAAKIDTKNKRIAKLEKQIMSLREQVENLKIQIEEYDDMGQGRQSILDLDFSAIGDDIDDKDPNNRGNIVKVVKSSTFKASEEIFG